MQNIFTKGLVLALLIAAPVVASESTTKINSSPSSKWLRIGSGAVAGVIGLLTLNKYRILKKESLIDQYHDVILEAGIKEGYATRDTNKNILLNDENNKDNMDYVFWDQSIYKPAYTAYMRMYCDRMNRRHAKNYSWFSIRPEVETHTLKFNDTNDAQTIKQTQKKWFPRWQALLF